MGDLKMHLTWRSIGFFNSFNPVDGGGHGHHRRRPIGPPPPLRARRQRRRGRRPQRRHEDHSQHRLLPAPARISTRRTLSAAEAGILGARGRLHSARA
uniref:Acyl-desaturase n=1 Tax=Arundo donax TaxID=35708 RepID=A0A0A9EE20_ARUDO